MMEEIKVIADTYECPHCGGMADAQPGSYETNDGVKCICRACGNEHTVYPTA